MPDYWKDPNPDRLARSMRYFPGLRWKRGVVVLAVGALTSILTPLVTAQAASYAPLSGEGSSWAAPAIDQWSTDVVGQGIHIDYNPDGSAAGRTSFASNGADFAGSDIQFLTQQDPFGSGTESVSTAYSYIPIVAGGTAFMYNLKLGNQKITNLRLSGQTLAKIFTGAITNWNDAAITKDYGRQLPSQPITVITRSDGSGASYQFTRYLAKTFPNIWYPFCHAHQGGGACGPTEFYPNFNGSQQKDGSDQVAGYVASPTYGEGSIAYDEYSYAKGRGLPVVAVENAAGYFSLPSDVNVAIALQAAVIDENPNSLTFLIQNLDKVYTMPDPHAYPVSSYSYLVVPRDSRVISGQTEGPPARFTTAKGKTLSTWLNYVLCGAQQNAGNLGYSPLPKNLVVGGFLQDDHIPGHVGHPDTNHLNGCNNPTYSDGVNHLIKDAKPVSICNKYGSPLNCTTGGGTGGNGGNGGNGGTSGSGGTSGNPRSGANSGGVSHVTGTTGPGANNNTPADANSDLLGGQTSNGDGSQQIYAGSVTLAGNAGGGTLFSVLTAVELLGAVLVPAVFGIWLRRRRARA